MWSAEVASNGPAFQVHQVRRLFSGEALMTFAVSGDGQRFLTPLRANQAAEPHLTLVQNWAAGLKAQ
ncbi:MAG: hypothetical protein FJW38_24575 [Acidobacteria bacterium]|nr:hypothetical protein [Acidobacteriota bacterium]